MMKRKLNKAMRGEGGQALIIALVLMLVGSIIVAPLLAYMGTGLKAGKEVYEERMYGQYAADAGVQDALYKITIDDPSFPEEWQDCWNSDSYSTSFGPPDYPPFQINGNDVSVTITPYWILTGLEDPPTGMTPHADMVVVGDSTGTAGSNGLYQIAISYDNSIGQLSIIRIGGWLPAGYDYVPGSSNLEQLPSSDKAYCVPVTEEFRGGTVITWDYSPPNPKFTDFPGGADGKAIITFEFTPQGNPLSAFSWVKSQRSDIYLSWDADIKVYQIESVAEGGVSEAHPVTVTVDAYASQVEPRKLGTGVSGDYVATGNGLLPYTSDPTYRDRLLIGSDATVSSSAIPASATVQAAYLYWSGWMDYHYKYWNEARNRWEWREISELDYDNYDDDLATLVETNAKVNVVSFGVAGSMTDVTADEWEVMESTGTDYEGTWIYNCLYDATAQVKQLITNGRLASNGTGTYTLEHASTVLDEQWEDYPEYVFDLYTQSGTSSGHNTGFPLGTPAIKLPGRPYETRYNYSHAGWSLIIIYTSPETKGHQLYLYDIANPNFTFTEGWAPGGVPDPDFDGDGSPGGRISGFLVPPMLEDDGSSDDAARITCFVGEGDAGITGDYLKVTGENGTWANLSDGYSTSNVWNSQSQGLDVVGIDVDTFHITWGSGIMVPGDTWAQVDPTTGSDGFTLIYIILSFRSEVISGGAISYVYAGG